MIKRRQSIEGLACTFRASCLTCYSARLSWALVLTWVSPFVPRQKQIGVLGWDESRVYRYEICALFVKLQGNFNHNNLMTDIERFTCSICVCARACVLTHINTHTCARTHTQTLPVYGNLRYRKE